MANEITEKTRIPIGWVATLLTIVVVPLFMAAFYAGVEFSQLRASITSLQLQIRDAWTWRDQQWWSKDLKAENKHLDLKVPSLERER